VLARFDQEVNKVRQNMIKVRRRIAGVAIASAAAVALALAVAACGGGVKNSGATSSAKAGTTGAVASGQTTTATSSGSTDTSTATGATTGAPTTVLAQQRVRVPNSRDATVDIAVLGLAVQGRLATLTVRFSPHFPSASPDQGISLYDMSDNALDQTEVSLVDPVGLKRYLVVRDSNNTALGADEVDTQAANDSSVVAHWTFAAPPANVTKIDVELGPFPPFDDVPISR
jgi:hypothetical protein